MDSSIQSIEDAIFKHPLPLLKITDEKVRRTIDKYLPFSTGFEIECAWLQEEDEDKLEKIFRTIPDLIHVECTSGENRFRIPAGLVGLVCLYRLSLLFKEHFHLTASGIHYHVDMTEWYIEAETVGGKEFIALNEKWILEELDTWGYTGTYNFRNVDRFQGNRQWVRFKSTTKTCEIRIGEMSFDYEVLAKRIIHANKIVRRLKGELFKFKESKKLVLLKRQLEELEGEEKQEEALPSQDQMNQFIKNRQIQVTHGRKPNPQ